MTDVDVAVINYETRDRLRACLASLPATLRGAPLRRVVVDNASRDGSARMVREKFVSQVELVANTRNLGFARAVNQALAITAGRYLLVLNADTEISAAAIEALHDFMERTPRAGLAGAQLLDDHGVVQCSCRRFYTLSAIVLRRTPLGRLLPDHPSLRQHLMLDWDHSDVRQVDWIQGACMMLRRAALAEVGDMDERFFLYFEDVDLCRRLAAAGWGVYYVPQAKVVHHYRRASHEGALFSAERAHHLLSAWRYVVKWQIGPRWAHLTHRGETARER
jgi:N-acetylglucosaminyl-diphospho-decaprenol L-rhamnosyltransferase